MNKRNAEYFHISILAKKVYFDLRWVLPVVSSHKSNCFLYGFHRFVAFNEVVDDFSILIDDLKKSATVLLEISLNSSKRWKVSNWKITSILTTIGMGSLQLLNNWKNIYPNLQTSLRKFLKLAVLLVIFPLANWNSLNRTFVPPWDSDYQKCQPHHRKKNVT